MPSILLPLLAFIMGIAILVLLTKLFFKPLKWLVRLIINGVAGGLMLLLLNYFGGFAGISIGINVVTCLTAGVLGVPGVALLLVLQYILKV